MQCEHTVMMLLFIVWLMFSHGHCQATNSKCDVSMQEICHQQQVILEQLKIVTNDISVMKSSIDDLKTFSEGSKVCHINRQYFFLDFKVYFRVNRGTYLTRV